MKKDENNPTRLFDILPLLETRKSRRACFRFEILNWMPHTMLLNPSRWQKRYLLMD